MLAGQVSGATPLVSTRLCNLWLSKNVIFAEIAGRAFGGDLERWRQLLRVLQGKPAVPTWRRLWGESEPGWSLRGVIGFCDVKELMAWSSDPQHSERYSRDWQERLRVVSEVFGVNVPVYFLFTKSDAIPYFPDFFRRLTEPDARRVLGCTLPIRTTDSGHRTDATAQAEIRLLTASFRPINHALAERRLTHLAYEPDQARRSAIYEFPREFKRIRSTLVQFLVEVFRPQSLRAGPLLRGYYFTGVREVEAAAPDPGTSRGDWSVPNLAMDGTRLFRSDATQLSRAADVVSNVGRGRLVLRWMFASDLFHRVVLADPPMQKPVAPDPRFEFYRRVAFGTACGLCALLCFAFFCSWVQNRDLLHTVERAGALNSEKTVKEVTTEDLRSLEALRVQVARLTEYDREGAPWSLRWGLYAGGRMLGPARNAYFQRLQQFLLTDLNRLLVARLQGLPANPHVNDPYQSVYDALKTHLAISSNSCKPEPALVASVLKATDAETAQALGTDWQALAETQIDFYANELPYGNPVHLAEDPPARDRARQYLQQILGIERIYTRILADAEKTLAQPKRLRDLAPNYAQVLNGSGEVGAVFSPDGWTVIKKASRGTNAGAMGEPCVTGRASGVVGELNQDAEVARAIQRLFVRDYVKHWIEFVNGFSVAPYAGPRDAARRLEILSNHNSPLLALLAMTSNQTYFPKEPTGSDLIQGSLEKVHKILQKVTGPEKAPGIESDNGVTESQVLSTPADIVQVFQPVQRVVPPGSETWVTEKNRAYIDALDQLRHSMQEIDLGGNNPDPAVHQAASQNYDKALDEVRKIASDFKPVGDRGLDQTVQVLLEQPIRLTNRYIIRDMQAKDKGIIDGKLRSLCGHLKNTLRKYPF